MERLDYKMSNPDDDSVTACNVIDKSPARGIYLVVISTKNKRPEIHGIGGGDGDPPCLSFDNSYISFPSLIGISIFCAEASKYCIRVAFHFKD